MSFLKNNWIYIIVAFAVVFLVGIGYVTYNRLNELGTLQQEPAQIQPTPSADGPAEEVSVSFEITPAVQQQPTTFSCIELVATPLAGAAPLTVSFTGLASTDQSSDVLFNFDFGDTTVTTLTAPVISDDGIVTQLADHTYTLDGQYTALLSVETNGATETSTSCSITINVGDDAEPIEPIVPETDPLLVNTTPTPAPLATITPTSGIGGDTPLPTSTQIAQALTPTPTRTVATQSTPSPTPVSTSVGGTESTTPAPTTIVAVPNVPEAGTFEVTLIIAAAALFLVILAFAVL